MQTLTIDGSQGEGGGQILRTALSLAVLQQRPIRIERIRAGRAKPGLMRQHLVCVKAAAAISAADVRGAELGSTALDFVPNTLVGGAQHFAIGTAGSAMLVLQTLLPALLRADAPSRITIEGGTHNMLAPSACFLARCFQPQLARMGAQVSLEVDGSSVASRNIDLEPGQSREVQFPYRFDVPVEPGRASFITASVKLHEDTLPSDRLVSDNQRFVVVPVGRRWLFKSIQGTRASTPTTARSVASNGQQDEQLTVEPGGVPS